MLHPRARTMLLLSLPAVAIGIASSLILIVVMKIASVLQNLLWQRLPGTLGIAQDSPLWIIGVLTLTGIAVGLVIRFSQGHAGPDPACEPLIGAPVPPSALPRLIVALILGLAGGVSLGPEHPIMTVNIALAVAIGARLLPRVNRMEWTILASAGTIGALFGTPVAAALIFSQTLNGSSEVPLWDRLFAPLMAAAAGALTTGLFFHPHFSLPIAHYGQMEMTDILSGAIVAAIAIAAGMVAVWCLPRLHAMMNQMKNPVLVLGIGGFILGILGVIGGPVSLFKGLDEMQQMVANQAFSTSDYFLLAVIKLAALVVAAASGFRGGRIFPAVFVGVALGLMLHEHVPAVPAAITVSCAILGIVLVVTRDGWLSLFMAAVVVPNTTLLPLLCIVMLPAWLLLAGKPMMMVNRPKQQPPHDNV
ncbi:putative ion-transport protein yfeO [Shigella flexneri]|uniref:Putative ion-transport protein YfeO n=7 Tax=Shigella flexneri TaxID=623 RepID=YFEO_SHIFL|nr:MULTISPECIES: ion channel protein [Enterobacteriaceae]NP_708256.1 ion channel protein [Shigella flexneri 2a str. 301]P59585.1 RecName: Full=Putative ion-transport protein YfeO [Shigella flexneri]EFP6976513.1 ion channel protein [Shigella sonnei]EGJ85802.1 voltage gated chloride channel family protein [Shigella flexneri K-671]EGJ86746.1 voltage gated chloride channel family protein [Shigella flexneri 2747-71]EGK35750.1 voltage gated chloride channel family protein [Shigella flexneri K-304]